MLHFIKNHIPWKTEEKRAKGMGLFSTMSVGIRVWEYYLDFPK